MKHKQSPQNSTRVFVLPLALPLFSFPFSEAVAFKSFFLLVSWKWCHLVPICPKSQWAQISLWFPFQFVLCFIFNITWNASGCCWSKQIALLSNCYHSQKNTRPEVEFVQNFTLPDFQAKNFTPSISPNFNSFSGKKTQKMSENGEIYTASKNFTLVPAVTGGKNLTSERHLNSNWQGQHC